MWNNGKLNEVGAYCGRGIKIQVEIKIAILSLIIWDNDLEP